MKRTDSRLQYGGRFLEFWETGDGYEYIKRSQGSVVVGIIALTAQGELVLVDQYRPPVDNCVIGLPAGLVADEVVTETELAAAQRELFEETGFWSPEWELWIKGPLSSGSSSETMSLFVARDAEKRGAGGGDQSETIDVHVVPVTQLEVWLKSQESLGKWVDPKVLLGAYVARCMH